MIIRDKSGPRRAGKGWVGEEGGRRRGGEDEGIGPPSLSLAPQPYFPSACADNFKLFCRISFLRDTLLILLLLSIKTILVWHNEWNSISIPVTKYLTVKHNRSLGHIGWRRLDFILLIEHSTRDNKSSNADISIQMKLRKEALSLYSRSLNNLL